MWLSSLVPTEIWLASLTETSNTGSSLPVSLEDRCQAAEMNLMGLAKVARVGSVVSTGELSQFVMSSCWSSYPNPLFFQSPPPSLWLFSLLAHDSGSSVTIQFLPREGFTWLVAYWILVPKSWTGLFHSQRVDQNGHTLPEIFLFSFLSYWCQLGQRRDRKGRGEAEEAEGRQGSIQRRWTGLKSD